MGLIDMNLDKTTILAAKDLPIQVVPIPEWGGDVTLRTLNALDMDAFQQSIRGENGAVLNQVRERFLAAAMVDENGVRLFADEDFAALANKNPNVLARLFTAAQKLNGIGAAANAEIAKNLPGDPNDASSSGSPSLLATPTQINS